MRAPACYHHVSQYHSTDLQAVNLPIVALQLCSKFSRPLENQRVAGRNTRFTVEDGSGPAALPSGPLMRPLSRASWSDALAPLEEGAAPDGGEHLDAAPRLAWHRWEE